MQENTHFPCIHDLAPYLNTPLKMDNLPPRCKDASEEELRHFNVAPALS